MSAPLSHQEHQEIQELLGVYALDAVDKETADRIEAHLGGCVKCSIEVAEHHEVAGLMANSGGLSPARLWDGIASQIDGSVPPSWDRLAERLDTDDLGERPPRLVAAAGSLDAQDPDPAGSSDGANEPASNVVPLAEGRRRNRVAMRVAAVVAGVAAVVALLLGVQVHHLDQKVSALQVSPSLAAAASAAEAVPSTKTIELTSPTNNTGNARVVLTRSGTGFVLASGLSSLPKDQTYQLWGVVGDQTISLGLMGSAPRVVPFTVAGNARVAAFAITAEQAGGVVHSTHQPVVAGEVST